MLNDKKNRKKTQFRKYMGGGVTKSWKWRDFLPFSYSSTLPLNFNLGSHTEFLCISMGWEYGRANEGMDF